MAEGQSTHTNRPIHRSRLKLIGSSDVAESSLYRCECGTEKVVRRSHVKSGRVLSCGCLNREVASARAKTHGLTGSPEHRAWTNMITRCHNRKATGYDRYGGRGIVVCQRWRESFEAFLSDMGRRPSPAHSIDRIDNDGNYEPGNCRWATASEQGRNKRNSALITFRGETKTVTEWAEITGIDHTTIAARIRKHGMSPEEALTRPVRRRAA